jgi:hypothetical protein
MAAKPTVASRYVSRPEATSILCRLRWHRPAGISSILQRDAQYPRDSRIVHGRCKETANLQQVVFPAAVVTAGEMIPP